MPSGRIPKPKVIADLHGDRHRKDMTEPKASSDLPQCPPHLDAIAQAEWADVTPKLQQMGLLSATDERSIGLYCECYSRYRKLKEKVDQYGEVIISPANKYPMQSPFAQRMDKALDQTNFYLQQFGLTPVARAKCAVPTKQITDQKWKNILKVAS